MVSIDLLVRAREAAGLSRAELARRAGTSRPTLSAYEHGRKMPTLATALRVIAAAGYGLALEPRVQFQQVRVGGGRVIHVPDRLPRLALDRAVATVELPLHLNWSDVGRRFDLADRGDRARVYEIVLREGAGDDVLAFVDGAFLVDLWTDLVLPREVRAAWEPLMSHDTGVHVA